MEKYFDFLKREAEIYKMWEEAGALSFSSDDNRTVFNICTSLPNTKGELHLDQSLGNVAMDVLGRFNRLRGEHVQSIPGKAQEGSRTQVDFEQLLLGRYNRFLNNDIELLELINNNGTDALRFGLILRAKSRNNIRINDDQIKAGSHFVNKIWNAAKFAGMQLEGFDGEDSFNFENIRHRVSAWILTELIKTTKSVTHKIENCELSLAFQELYNFTCITFCDWYLEIYKIHFCNPYSDWTECKAVLQKVFAQLLTLLHPFIPFVTEEIYQQIPALRKNEDLLINSRWNKTDLIMAMDGSELKMVEQVVSSIRSIKAYLQISSQEINEVFLNFSFSEESLHVISNMAGVNFVTKAEIREKPFIVKPTHRSIIYFATEKMDRYRRNMRAELTRLERLIQKGKSKLDNPKFVNNASREILEQVESFYKDNIKNLNILKREMAINRISNHELRFI